MEDVRKLLTSNALIVLPTELIFNLLDLCHSCGYHIQSMRFHAYRQYMHAYHSTYQEYQESCK